MRMCSLRNRIALRALLAWGLAAGAAAVGGAAQSPVVRQENPDDGSVLRAWAEVEAPERLHYTEPVLDDAALRRGHGDDLLVECTVDPTGHVVEVEVLNGAPALREAVQAAASQWRYEPTEHQGQPVSVRLLERVELWAQDEVLSVRWPPQGEDGEEWVTWPEGRARLELVEYSIGGRHRDDSYRELTGRIRNRTKDVIDGLHAVGFHRNSLGAAVTNVAQNLGTLGPGEEREFVLKPPGLQTWSAFYQLRDGEPRELATRRQRWTLTRVPKLDHSGRSPSASDDAQAGVAKTSPELASTPPRPEKMTSPEYPSRAYEARIEGTVVLEIWIGSRGFVDRARVLQGLPGTGLDAEALRTVFEWRFEPATLNGEPVMTAARAPVTFRIY